MSFANMLRRAFGFGSSGSYPEENDTLLSDSEESATAGGSTGAPAGTPPHDPATQAPECPTFDPDVQKRIFDGVVEVFNASMPEFIRNSLDTEKQREYLYSVMEQSLKDYLGKLIIDSQNYAEARLRSQNDANNAELDRLRGETKKLEQQRSSIKEQQLSADRQRRALSERVKDLEGQVASLEAEREQYQLENMSLLNKVKLGDVRPAVIEELNAEIERLTTENSALASENTKLQAASHDESSAPGADTARALEKEIEELRQTVELHKEQHRSATTMLNDLQHQLVAERKAKDEANEKLREAAQIESEVETIQRQMEAVGELIAKRDAKIAKLRSTNKELRRRLTAAENAAQAAARNASIAQLTMELDSDEPNLFTVDRHSSNATTADIAAEPKSTYGDTNGSPDSEAEMLTTSPIKEEDIDDGFEAADWFVSVPPQGTTLRSEIGESDFGYHEPPKKPSRKENDAQMSLF